MVQQWEYLEIRVGGGWWFDSAGQRGMGNHLNPETETGQLPWSSPIPRLQELGRDGWELVGTVAGPELGGYKLFLKRAIAVAE